MPAAPRPGDRHPAQVSGYRLRAVRLSYLSIFLFVACSSDAGAPKDKPVETPPGKMAGVFPDRFDCTTIVSIDALASLLGGNARRVEGPMGSQRGVPKPCEYEIASDPPAKYSYDFDCREGYKKTADALFKQYREQNAARIEEYNRASDAGPPAKAPKGAEDAAVEMKQPSEPQEVAVGAKGLDHNDQGILFIDDDAPCYVRVYGPDAAKRLELAKLVAKHLTYVNAPMDPRPLK